MIGSIIKFGAKSAIAIALAAALFVVFAGFIVHLPAFSVPAMLASNFNTAMNIICYYVPSVKILMPIAIAALLVIVGMWGFRIANSALQFIRKNNY